MYHLTTLQIRQISEPTKSTIPINLDIDGTSICLSAEMVLKKLYTLVDTDSAQIYGTIRKVNYTSHPYLYTFYFSSLRPRGIFWYFSVASMVLRPGVIIWPTIMIISYLIFWRNTLPSSGWILLLFDDLCRPQVDNLGRPEHSSALQYRKGHDTTEKQ